MTSYVSISRELSSIYLQMNKSASKNPFLDPKLIPKRRYAFIGLGSNTLNSIRRKDGIIYAAKFSWLKHKNRPQARPDLCKYDLSEQIYHIQSVAPGVQMSVNPFNAIMHMADTTINETTFKNATKWLHELKSLNSSRRQSFAAIDQLIKGIRSDVPWDRRPLGAAIDIMNGVWSGQKYHSLDMWKAESGLLILGNNMPLVKLDAESIRNSNKPKIQWSKRAENLIWDVWIKAWNDFQSMDKKISIDDAKVNSKEKERLLNWWLELEVMLKANEKVIDFVLDLPKEEKMLFSSKLFKTRHSSETIKVLSGSPSRGLIESQDSRDKKAARLDIDYDFVIQVLWGLWFKHRWIKTHNAENIAINWRLACEVLDSKKDIAWAELWDKILLDLYGWEIYNIDRMISLKQLSQQMASLSGQSAAGKTNLSLGVMNVKVPLKIVDVDVDDGIMVSPMAKEKIESFLLIILKNKNNLENATTSWREIKNEFQIPSIASAWIDSLLLKKNSGIEQKIIKHTAL